MWNVGPNSAIQNATGWQQQNCGDVVFSDFEFRYACANSITEFADISLGSIESYHWNFGDTQSSENESNKQNPTHQFTAIGDYTVTLTVTSNGISHSYSRLITILPNTLPETIVEYNSESLFSSAEAESYQWFANDQLLTGETKRFYSYSGTEGYYRVVLYDDYCNSPSEWLVITGLNTEELWRVYPNPAIDRIYFSMLDAESLFIRDCLGRTLDVPWNASESWADVTALSPGLYVLIVKKEGREMTRRIWVNK
jgi:PKD repeat protein